MRKATFALTFFLNIYIAICSRNKFYSKWVILAEKHIEKMFSSTLALMNKMFNAIITSSIKFFLIARTH